MTSSPGRQPPEWLPTSRQLGASIQAARLAKHMSQSDLGRLVGLSQPAISQLEHCRWRRVRGTLLEVLADVLEVEVAALRDAAGSPEERVAVALREALVPMADQPADEQAHLAAVVQSLIAWRYGPDPTSTHRHSRRDHQQQSQTRGLS